MAVFVIVIVLVAVGILAPLLLPGLVVVLAALGIATLVRHRHARHAVHPH